MPVKTKPIKEKPDPLLQSILTLQTRHRFFQEPCTIVIGVSGGADSVCLLHLLWTFNAHQLLDLHFDLHVAHLDHGLRPESSADAKFVQELAATLDLPYHSETVAKGALESKGGIEDAARRARYTFLGRIAANVTPPEQVPIIAVAHNADDQAETVLMNFVRGSGLDGLGGMKWKSDLPVKSERATSQREIQLVRPLLETARAEIEAYLARHNLRWCEDGTNSDKKFLRNRLRHEIVPLLKEINPDLLNTLGRNADIMRAEAERINKHDAETLAEIMVQDGRNSDGRILLYLEMLRSLDLATMRNTLRLALLRICKERRDIQFAIIESLVQVVQSTVDPIIETSGPNTLVGGICWTILPTGLKSVGLKSVGLKSVGLQQPARLSLHQCDLLPEHVDHPLLDESQQALDIQHFDIQHFDIQRSGTLAIDGGWVLRSRTILTADLPKNWKQHDPWAVYLDSDLVIAPRLCSPAYANVAPKFAPLGMAGQHKSIGDFFTDRKILPALRSKWPLVVEAGDGRVLWVCGLQPAHDARITGKTMQVLHLWWERDR